MISEFNRLTDNKYTNISDIFNYSYEDDFTRFLYNEDLLNQENNNPTNTANHIVDFLKKLNNNNFIFPSRVMLTV